MLPIILLAAAGGIGYYFYNKKKKADQLSKGVNIEEATSLEEDEANKEEGKKSLESALSPSTPYYPAYTATSMTPGTTLTTTTATTTPAQKITAKPLDRLTQMEAYSARGGITRDIIKKAAPKLKQKAVSIIKKAIAKRKLKRKKKN